MLAQDGLLPASMFFDSIIPARKKMANGKRPKFSPGHQFLQNLGLRHHLIYVQVKSR